MKIRKFSSEIFSAIAISALSFGAAANEGGFFVQADVGGSNVDFKGRGISVSEFGGTDRSTNNGDSSGTSSTLRGGYWFNKYFGVEAFYGRFYDGNIRYTEVSETLNPDGSVWASSTEAESAPLEVSGYGVGLVAKKNFSGLFISGRVGAATSKVKVPAGSESTTKAYYGVSVGYDFSDSFGLSLNYDIHKAEFSRDELIDGQQINFDSDFDIKTASLGAQYRF